MCSSCWAASRQLVRGTYSLLPHGSWYYLPLCLCVTFWILLFLGEPVWPSGKAWLVSRGTSVWIRFGSPFSSKVVVCVHCLVTLSLTINETLKWLSLLPILMHESFCWWQCSDRYIIYLLPTSSFVVFLFRFCLFCFLLFLSMNQLITIHHTWLYWHIV